MKECRYLERYAGAGYCVYWDLPLREDEDLRCYPGGCEYYEDPDGCIFEGRWMTLTEYAEYLERKSERELPEGAEFQEFRLDSEALADLSGSRKRYSLESMSGEFHHLKMRPEYPHNLRMAALAHFRYATEAEPSRLDRHEGPYWVASLWLMDGSCQVDLTVALRGEGLEFIEGGCLHGELCPGIERMRRAALESDAFKQVREDLVRELFQATVAHLHLADPPPSQGTAAPWEEEEHLRSC